MRASAQKLLIVFGALGFLSGCATYQSDVQKARQAITDQNPEKAVEVLKPLAEKEGRDQLVYLLDYATALQQAGQFRDSAQAFEKAAKIADIQDYHSVTKIAAAALLSENAIQYKGDNFEKVMINGINAINYLEIGNLDDALVEARRLNQKLYRFKNEGGIDYDQNPYAFYLSALLYEADRKYDDAYIDYKNAYDNAPDYYPLREDLIRLAKKSGRSDDLEKWRKQFPEVKPRPEWNDKNVGEIILIYQQGWGPRKGPRPDSPRFPKLFAVSSRTQAAKLAVTPVEGNTDFGPRITTEVIFNVERVAIKTLDDDYGRLVASRVGGVVAKAVVADQIRQKNELLGLAAWIALNVADQADTRQWSTLPQTLQIARVYVPAGKYRINVSGLTGAGFESGEVAPEKIVEVKPGKRAFVNWRSVK